MHPEVKPEVEVVKQNGSGMKNSLEELISRFEMAEERIEKHEKYQ